MLGDLSAYLNTAGIEVAACPVRPQALAELLGLLEDGTLSGKMAKEVFEAMCEQRQGGQAIVAEKGLGQISDTGRAGGHRRPHRGGQPRPG